MIYFFFILTVLKINMSSINKDIKLTTKILRPPIFNINDEHEWLAHLEDEGFSVIDNAISVKDANESFEMFREELSYVSPNFDWNDSSTWISENCPMIMNKSSVVYNGFGQSDSNWNLRLKSVAKEAFKIIYETNQVVSSFDGLSLFINCDKQQSSSWLHQDQRSNDNRLSIQGILNIFECNKYDAGFVCIPKSHIEYVPPPSNNDWLMLPKNHIYHKEKVKLLTPERSLILFNSKLVHANVGMNKKHPKGNHVNRFSAYLTFGPRHRQTQEIIQRRINGYFSGDSCSHWSDRYDRKKIPMHIIKRIQKFKTLKPSLDSNGNIPIERLEFI